MLFFLALDVSVYWGEGARHIYDALQVFHHTSLHVVVEAHQAKRQEQQIVLARILSTKTKMGQQGEENYLLASDHGTTDESHLWSSWRRSLRF